MSQDSSQPPPAQLTPGQITPAQNKWLEHFLVNELQLSDWQMQPPIADASFRAYTRITHDQGSYMLMHFPPNQENGDIIISSSKFFISNNIRVPQLLGYDLGVGVVLQEDMGTELLSDYNQIDSGIVDSGNNDENIDDGIDEPLRQQLYQKSLGQLNLLQGLDASDFGYLDSDKLLGEMHLFDEWFIGKWLGTPPSVNWDELKHLYLCLVEQILMAPQCCTHLDFHSRNICILKSGGGKNIGLLDYQDLLQGHFCYDIWSLLKDAYVRLPQGMSDNLFKEFSATATQKFAITNDYVRLHYNIIGVQRCLKVCGVFSRLFLRDGKEHYLPHIPLVMEHLNAAITSLLEDDLASNDLTNGLRGLGELLPQLSTLVEQKLLRGSK